MRKAVSLVMGLAMGAVCVNAAVAGDHDKDVGRLFGDFNAGNAGFEVAIPRFRLVDVDLDGYADQIRVWYDTYAAGTSTKLYSSGVVTMATPALPAGCDPADAAQNQEFNPEFHRRDGSSRITMSIALATSCFDGATQQNRDSTAVYSASVASAGGAPWKYLAANRSLTGMSGIDTDGDQINDSHLLVMDYTSPNGMNVQAVVLDGATGSVMANNSYAVVR